MTTKTGVGIRDIRFGPLVQDTKGVELEDGTVYPPTLDWHSTITAVREDGKDFYVLLVIPNNLITNHLAVYTKVQLALASLEHYMRG